jgi:hypothetical protein
MKEISPSATPRFAVCVCNDEYPVALELNKVYQVLPDASAERIGWLRIVDESGEDYLYPQTFFQLVDVPHTVEESVLRAS